MQFAGRKQVLLDFLRKLIQLLKKNYPSVKVVCDDSVVEVELN